MADCWSRVISTPLLMVFLGGSVSLYTPAILAAGEKHQQVSGVYFPKEALVNK
jgi:hypothetical protein